MKDDDWAKDSTGTMYGAAGGSTSTAEEIWGTRCEQEGCTARSDATIRIHCFGCLKILVFSRMSDEP